MTNIERNMNVIAVLRNDGHIYYGARIDTPESFKSKIMCDVRNPTYHTLLVDSFREQGEDKHEIFILAQNLTSDEANMIVVILRAGAITNGKSLNGKR
jgi:hypothetical protein